VDADRAPRATRLLARVGSWSTVLTCAILAASVLLRLSTAFDAGGAAQSRLPELVETISRLAHRFAAMAVSVLALLAAMVAFTTRPLPRGRLAAVATILVLTVFLAVLGRYTPGYAAAAVTVGNVVGGMLLACAFWWLREDGLLRSAPPGPRAFVLAGTAFAALVGQSALGAATSAIALRSASALDPLHAAAGVACAILVGFAAWPHRHRASSRLPAGVAAGAVAMQLALGPLLALAGGARPAALAWAHGMVALALALALVSLAARSR